MRGKLIVIKPDGSKTVTELTSSPDLTALQKAVGGIIQIVPAFEKYENRDCVAFCHEEGKLIGLPENPWGHSLWEAAIGQIIADDYLVGPIAIVTGDRELLESL